MKGEQPAHARNQGNSPVVVLSYAFSGAYHVQEMLGADTELACTAGTGIIPLCDVAGETWRRVEGRTGHILSPLAVSTIRGIASAQITTILAGAGKSRWCELATAPANAMAPFLQAFPNTGIVSVHRTSLDVIRAGARANPWGLQDQALLPYLLAHPANSVAALAAYWAHSTEQLLGLEGQYPAAVHRVRYEDVAADPARALVTVRASLGLHDGVTSLASPECSEPQAPNAAPAPTELVVPVEMIPEPLLKRITRLHAELDYPPPHGAH